VVGWSQDKRLFVCTGNVDWLRPLLPLEFEDEVSLRCLGAGTFYSTSEVASSAVNVAESSTAELSLLARSAGRSTSLGNVTASGSSAATGSAIVSVPTLPNCISVMLSVV
jgi:hypothetical protein